MVAVVRSGVQESGVSEACVVVAMPVRDRQSEFRLNFAEVCASSVRASVKGEVMKESYGLTARATAMLGNVCDRLFNGTLLSHRAGSLTQEMSDRSEV